jgi:hypothetical protein
MTAHLVENDTEISIGGAYYTSVLEQIHIRCLPRSYFEVGTLHGETLRLSRTRSVAVDPMFQLRDFPVDRSRVTLRQMTSDDYFARHSPRRDLGRRIDFAFLDGMHEFPYLLRDFINTEKVATRRSIIAMHDCIPLDVYMTRLHDDLDIQRSTRYPGYWTGDVWKMIPVLRKYRPDLEVHCLDALPTGLTVVRNPDPENTILRDAYDEIMRDWERLTLDEYGMDKLFEATRIESASAWIESAAPINRSLLRSIGRLVQPRRRLQKIMTTMGLEAH